MQLVSSNQLCAVAEGYVGREGRKNLWPDCNDAFEADKDCVWQIQNEIENTGDHCCQIGTVEKHTEKETLTYGCNYETGQVDQ